MEQHLLICGASVRAAAFSALRAGLRPWCADLFADADLERVCPVVRLTAREYPVAFLRLFDKAPPGPWLYTGALENRPDLVRLLTQVRPLWANDSRVLRRIRRPWEVAAWLRGAGVPCPEVRRAGNPGPSHGRWLVKSLAGGGGRGIQFWSDSSQGSRLLTEGVYFQEYIEGEACAAVYAADSGRALLLGVTRQLVGESWLYAAPFQYCGSVGALSLNGEIVAAFVQLGDALVSGFGLRGLFGVDCVLRDGVPYPVEINPRYTASVEVVEHALGIATMGLHRLAFTAEPGIASSPLSPPGRGVGGEAKSHQSLAGLPLTPNPSPRRGEGGKGEGKTHQSLTGSPLAPNPSPRWREGGKQVIGKAILFARERLVIPSAGPWTTALDLPITELPPFADIPHAGEVIDRGQPILTVLARADGVDRCLDDLRQRVHALDHWLFGR